MTHYNSIAYGRSRLSGLNNVALQLLPGETKLDELCWRQTGRWLIFKMIGLRRLQTIKHTLILTDQRLVLIKFVDGRRRFIKRTFSTPIQNICTLLTTCEENGGILTIRTHSGTKQIFRDMDIDSAMAFEAKFTFLQIALCQHNIRRDK